MRIVVVMFAVVLGLGMVVALHAEPQLSGTAAELETLVPALPRTAVITGQGEVKSEADRAVLKLTLKVEKDTLAEAMGESRRIRSEIAKSLTDAGVPADAIHWQKFASSAKSGFFSFKSKSHVVENQLSVTVASEEHMQKLAELTGQYKGLELSGIEFDHSRKDEMRLAAIKDALADADARKKLYEQELGLSLVARSVHEAAGETPGVQPAVLGTEYERMGGQRAHAVVAPQMEVSRFAEIIFKAQVVVEYAASVRASR